MANMILLLLSIAILNSVNMCSDNCIAYRGSMYTNSLPANMFYLQYLPREGYCTHCYFTVNASNKYGFYTFQLGLYDPSAYIFYNAINGDLYASSGFSSCSPGYCAVWFANGYTSFNIQMTEVQPLGKCLYNSSYCSGYVDSRLSNENTSPKKVQMNCTLS